MEDERKIKRKIQMIVGTAVTVMACLVLVLIVQLIILANKNIEERTLETRGQELLQAYHNQEALAEHLRSERFTAEWALRNLNLGKPGAQHS